MPSSGTPTLIRSRDFLDSPTASRQLAPNLRLPLHLGTRSSPNTSILNPSQDPTDIRTTDFATTTAVASSPPIFAEQLGRSPLIRHRRGRRLASALPFSLGVDAALDEAGKSHLGDAYPTLPAGSSALGWFDDDTGDLFRGASQHPGMQDGFSQAYREKKGANAEADDDSNDGSQSDADSETSSDSSSSSGSGLELARRMGEAIDRVGDVLGVGRRGSNASTSSSSTLASKSTGTALGTAISDGGRRRGRNRRSRTTRAFSLGTRRSASPDSHTSTNTRRVRLPKRREFCLMLPLSSASPVEDIDIGDIRTSNLEVDVNNLPPQHVAFADASPVIDLPSLHGRLVTTPSLPIVLGKIRDERIRTGYQDPAELQARAEKLARDLEANKKLARKQQHHQRKRMARRQARDQKRGMVSTKSERDRVQPFSASDLLGINGNRIPRTFEYPARQLPPPSILPRLESSTTPTPPEPAQPFKGCWWLDVSCPTWEDLRDIGEMLHIHPLTLEDILQQDPREKIDVFENLGYYLVVFRAIDETYFKYTAPEASGTTNIGIAAFEVSNEKALSSRGRLEIVEDRPGKEGLEGLAAGGLNVYLVVFKDGVISFHFDDISKHLDRVRDRILQLKKDTASAEWIAHGLMDSIVDAFFPLITHVDIEVDEIDSLVTDPSSQSSKKAKPDLPIQTDDLLTRLNVGIGYSGYDVEMEDLDGKGRRIRRHPQFLPLGRQILAIRWRRITHRTFTVFNLQGSKLRSVVRNMRGDLHILPRSPKFWKRAHTVGRFLGVYGANSAQHNLFADPVFDRSAMLRRITDIRRIVAGLTRLLSAKLNVITRLKRRAKDGDAEVVAYIGDVQDHIIMLQTSLNHYEYILSHCQPAYLSQLGMTAHVVRGDTDKMILALSCVTIGILPMQCLVGLFSMNVRVPQNGDPTSHNHKESDGSQSPFNFFYSIVAGTVLIATGVFLLVRYWRWQAKQKWGRINALRAAQLESHAVQKLKVARP